MPPPLIVAIGDLVEDIVVTPSSALRSGTDVLAGIARRRGGSAANFAASVVRAGARSRFVGTVGVDSIGDRLVDALTTEGVEVVVERVGRSGTVIVLVESGERSFLTDRGSAPEMKHHDPEVLLGASWLHVPAYALQVDPQRATTLDLLEVARASGIPSSVDASGVSVIETIGNAVFMNDCVNAGISVLFANEIEARHLDLPKRALDAGIPTVVVKRGSRPTVVSTHTGRRELAPKSIENLKDPTGAGDAFAAGYVVANLSGEDACGSAAAGNNLAHLVLTTPRKMI